MRRLCKKYYHLMRVAWLILLEYRGETFFYMFGSFVTPLVTLAVWLAVAREGQVGGYGTDDLIRYFLAAMFVMRLTISWDVWELDVQIREGTFSSYLVRPFNPIHWRIAENLVYKLFYLAIMAAVWGIAWFFFPAVRLQLTGWQWGAAAAAIMLAAAIRYLFGYCIGLLAFWTNRSVAVFTLLDGIGYFLRGMIAPLALLPPFVRWIAEISPFYWMLGFPVDLLTRPWTQMAALHGFVVQGIWMIALFTLYVVMWRMGLKKYGAAGG
ncbi:ABC transporter permease [Effusibacillus pohliae]|uniref:ABC transporter permease n=1 Tax=Effusibacillus pohliae TaxID=232270 RepID=UPI000377A152|nr:ABC-2 family transporter protein [Effusibacillus pohliae]